MVKRGGKRTQVLCRIAVNHMNNTRPTPVREEGMGKWLPIYAFARPV